MSPKPSHTQVNDMVQNAIRARQADSAPSVLSDSRRAFLNSCGIGFGGIALSSLFPTTQWPLRASHILPLAQSMSSTST